MKGLATRAHARLYRLSGGRILGRMGGQPVLLLETVGRRTGRTHTTPVQFLPRDGAFVVVAANRGAARPPSWFLNLCAAPNARVRIGAQDVDVTAREVRDSERDGLWRELTAANRYLARVARKARHPLPVLVLAPAEVPASNQNGSAPLAVVALGGGDSWRRVVPSPDPKQIIQPGAIRSLVDAGLLVVCVGGGGFR